MNSELTVIDQGLGAETLWQDFVSGHLDACWGHDLRWRRVIERAYRHECRFLTAQRDGAIEGILPLAILRSRIFGRNAVSLPFLDSAGVLASSDEARTALIMESARLAGDAGADVLELRQTDPLPGEPESPTRKVTLTLALPSDEDALFKSLPSERRNRVRKARKTGLVGGVRGPEALNEFYAVWSENMRDLGSPPHSRRFFREVLDAFGPDSSILTVEYEGAVVGAALALRIGSTYALPWVSALRAARNLYPNNLLYWDAMCRAIEAGCDRFDFGRSTIDSGTYTFKKRWGADVRSLHWRYHGLRGQQVEGASHESGALQLASRVWKHLPLSIANWIGPSIRRNIPA